MSASMPSIFGMADCQSPFLRLPTYSSGTILCLKRVSIPEILVRGHKAKPFESEGSIPLFGLSP